MPANPYGVRIALLPPNVLCVQQTKYNGEKHVIDHSAPGKKIERMVAMDDDAGIAEAVRLAIEGKLTKSAKV